MPGAPQLRVEGFDELDTAGDWRAILTAVGLDPEPLGDDGEFGDEAFLDYDRLLHALTGGALSVHTDEEGEQEIRGVWLS